MECHSHPECCGGSAEVCVSELSVVSYENHKEEMRNTFENTLNSRLTLSRFFRFSSARVFLQHVPAGGEQVGQLIQWAGGRP